MNEIIKNDEMMCSDDFPESLKRFSENINKKNPGLHSENHNLYLLQTTDRDGNITGEAYGMNLMTNWGFKTVYLNNNSFAISSNKIFIGNGTDEPVLTNNALYSPIITTGSTNISTTYYIYPFQYDSNTDVGNVKRLVYKGYFDYNLSGITENKEITEVGYGDSVTSLYTHTKIYDSNGNPSSITKRINERLTITVFCVHCCKMSIIEELYNKKLYVFINPNTMFMEYKPTYYELYVSGCGRDLHLVSYTDITKSRRLASYRWELAGYRNMIDENLIKWNSNSIKTNEFFIQSSNEYVSNIIASRCCLDSSRWGSCDFYIIKKVNLPEPEELISYNITTNSISSSLITDEFGWSSSSLPCTNFNITSLSMYNHLTKEWDIEEEFVSDPDVEYNDVNYVYGSMYLTFQGKSFWASIWINTRTDLPITSFNNSNIVLYATDKYWDTSTWKLISNLSNVDESLQCKRYYIITNGDLVQLYPDRNMIKHQIVVNKNTYKISAPSYSAYYSYRSLSSDNYGWIMQSIYLVYPKTEDGCSYLMSVGPNNVNPDKLWRWTTDAGDRLIFACWYYDSNTKKSDIYLRIYNTTNPESEPTYVDMKLDFTNQLSEGKSCSIYCTDSGFLAAKAFDNTTSGQMVVVDIYGTGEGPTQHRVDDVYTYHVLNRTDNVVYCGHDNHTSFKIYDMKNQTIIDSFSIPSGYTYSAICGWKNFIYVRVKDSSDTYSTFFYNASTKILQHLLWYTPDISSTYTEQFSVDECMIIGRSDAGSNERIWCFKETDPTNPIKVIDSGNNYSYYRLLPSAQLKYVNDGKQLLLINGYVYQQSSIYYRSLTVFDIGHLLDNGNVRHVYRNITTGEYYYESGTNGFFDNNVYITTYYGITKIYPIENFVNHKIVGTTTTIQSYNNPKQLGGCQVSIYITNDMNRSSVDTPTTDEST